MRNRVRRAWVVVAARSRGAARWCTTAVDKDDVFTLIGLALVVSGLWLWSRPLALIVPGALVLWVFLPARPPFIEKPAPSNRVARRPPS